MSALVNLVSGLAGVVNKATADGSATFTVPGAASTLSTTSKPGEPVELVTGGNLPPGATSMSLKSSDGEPLQGAISEGVGLEIGGEALTVTHTMNARFGSVAVVFSPALVGIYPAETPVATSAGAFVAQHVTTIGEKRSPVDFSAEGITFAFQFNRDAAGFTPRKGWQVTRSHRHGDRVGTVKRVDHTGVQVLVYAGN